METVKVTAPAHFADFCVALNEPFYYCNGNYYLIRWSDPKAARQFCADNGVRPRDLEEMTFGQTHLRKNAGGFWVEYDPSDVYAELDAISGRRHTDREKEAMAAYRRELNEYGSVGMSREAFIEDYIDQNF